MAKENSIIDVPINKIIVDSRYQRSLDEKHVRRLLNEWDQKACQPLTLARRLWSNDYELAVMDGQHRFEAQKRLGATHVRSEIIDVGSVGEEAELFTRFNGNRKQVTHRDVFTARMTAGEQKAEHIKEIVEKTGFRFAANAQWAITATKALETSYERFGPDILQLSLETIAKIWKGDQRSTRHQIIEGMGLFIAAGGREIELDKLVKKLEIIPPDTIIRKSKMMNIRESSTATDIAKVFGSYYNYRATTNRVEIDDLVQQWISRHRTSIGKEVAKKQDKKAMTSAANAANIARREENAKKVVGKKPEAAKSRVQQFQEKPAQADGFETRNDAGWKIAMKIKDALDEIRGNSATLEAVSRKIYEIENISYPENNSYRKNEMENRIRKTIANQGEHMNIAIKGNVVFLQK